MFKLFIILSIAYISICNALPSVQDIKNAMYQNNVYEVEQLSKQVIAQYPNSPKAHYFLGEAYFKEHKISLAHQEFITARTIDPSLNFTSNPDQFNHFLYLTEHHAVVHSLDLSWIWWLLLLLIGFILIALLIRLCTPRRIEHTTYVDSGSPTPYNTYRGNGANSTAGSSTTIVNNGGGYRGGYGGGMMGGSGFVEGMILGEILEDHNRGNNGDYNNGGGNTDSSPSYDSGTSSNWDDGGSSSSSWDSDSSSSFDSGSSGSDW